MKKIISLVASSSLFFLITLAIMILTMAACSSRHYQTNIHEINAEFNHISIKTDTADIIFLPSDDETCRVVCYEDERKSHCVEVQDGTLSVNVADNKKWYDYIGVNIDSPKITVYLPDAEYSSLVTEASTGDIEMSTDFEFKSIDISLSTGKVTVSDITCEGDITIGVSTGDVYLTDIVCKNLISTGSTGDISLKNVICAEKISVERDTGDVTFEGSDAAELSIKTDTGSVKGSLLTDKIFIAKSDTGRIDVPSSVTGGKCEITTDTGNIKISVLGD